MPPRGCFGHQPTSKFHRPLARLIATSRAMSLAPRTGFNQHRIAREGGYGKASDGGCHANHAPLNCRHLVCFFTSCGIDRYGRSTPTARWLAVKGDAPIYLRIARQLRAMAASPFSAPPGWHFPTEPSLDEFEAIAAKAFRRLPQKFRALCEDLAIRVEDFPTSDIMEFTFDEAQGRKPYLERFIHAALYEARPDINSVVHNARRSRWPEDHHWRSISPVLDPVHVVVREAEVVADLVHQHVGGGDTARSCSASARGHQFTRRADPCPGRALRRRGGLSDEG